MIDYFLFLLFIFFLLLAGRGVTVILNYFLENKFLLDEEEIFGIKLLYFYPIIGLFTIGNFAIIYNFVIPINQRFFLFCLLILLPNFLKNFQLKILRAFVLKASIITLPLLVGFLMLVYIMMLAYIT